MREQMHVRIVPMTGDHLDEVAELERICFTTPWSRNMLVEELQNDCAAFLVALDDEDHVAGYAGLLVVLDEGYITNVAVRPECRRNGIAQKLLQVFLDFAQAHKLAFLTLEVRASNYGAIALYGSRGFRSAGGFVCQNQLGVRDEGPGHSSPLLLAAGDLIGVFRQDVRDAQLICDGAELLLHLPVVCARQHQGQIDVVLKGEGVQQVEVLEHEPQVGPAEGRQIPLPDGREGPALQ